MFDGHRMMTARQLYFTLATAFASYKYGRHKTWHLEAVSAPFNTAEPVALQQAVDVECREHPKNEKGASMPAAIDGDSGNPELFLAAQTTAPARQPETFSQSVADEPHLPAGSRLRLSGAGNCTG